MQKKFKRWILLALFMPALVTAQALPSQQQSKVAASAPVAIDAEKRAAIKALLSSIEEDKLVTVIGNSAQIQAKQLVPDILSDVLARNEKISEEQKRALVPQLQQNAIPKLVNDAGKVFDTPKFKEEAINVQYQAYAKYYTTQQIKDLTAFYTSPTGREFIRVQDQVGREVINGLLQKYMPQAVQATKAQAEKELSAIARKK